MFNIKQYAQSRLFFFIFTINARLITEKIRIDLAFLCVFFFAEALPACKGQIGGLWPWNAGGRRCFLHPERRPREELVLRSGAEEHPLQPAEESSGLQP